MTAGKEIKIAAACAVGALLLLFPRHLVEHEMAPAPVLSFKEAAQKLLSPEDKFTFRKTKVPARSMSKEPPLPGSSELSLQGIIYEPQGKSTAILNDEIVSAGDTVGDYLVIEIKAEEVILEKKGDRYSLSTLAGLKKTGKGG